MIQLIFPGSTRPTADSRIIVKESAIDQEILRVSVK